MIHHLVPSRWAVQLLSTTSFMSLTLVTLYFNSIFYGAVYSLVAWMFIFQNILPVTLLSVRGDLIIGSTYAVHMTQLIGFYLYICPFVSQRVTCLYLLPMIACYVFVTFKFRVTKAQTLSSVSREELARQIIESSAGEGPDEEGWCMTH